MLICLLVTLSTCSLHSTSLLWIASWCYLGLQRIWSIGKRFPIRFSALLRSGNSHRIKKDCLQNVKYLGGWWIYPAVCSRTQGRMHVFAHMSCSALEPFTVACSTVRNTVWEFYLHVLQHSRYGGSSLAMRWSLGRYFQLLTSRTVAYTLTRSPGRPETYNYTVHFKTIFRRCCDAIQIA